LAERELHPEVHGPAAVHRDRVSRAAAQIRHPHLLVREIVAPCGESRSTKPLASTLIASLGGRGKLAPSDAFTARQDIASPLAPWLLGIALAAALAELLVRRRSPNPVAA